MPERRWDYRRSTPWVILEAVFTANHLIDTDKTVQENTILTMFPWAHMRLLI